MNRNFKNKIKDKFTLSNILFTMVLIIVIVMQAPVWLNNFQNIGMNLNDIKIRSLSKSEQLIPLDANKVIVFWFSNCAPCKLEMKRLKASVDDKKINKDNLIFINIFESKTKIKKFLKRNPYPFTFGSSPSLVKRLGITATPTMVFLENGDIRYMSSGMSLIGIFLAELFL